MLFMHDLIAHFTGILIHRRALETYRDLTQFPWVNKRYSMAPYLFDFLDPEERNLNQELKTLLRCLPLSRVALGEALPFGKGRDWLIGKCVGLFGGYKPVTQAYLPNIEDQTHDLVRAVREICRLYEISNIDVVEKNWLCHVKRHTTNRQQILGGNSILVGSRNNLKNRKLSINYLSQNKEVIAITHGEVANSVMDEPPFGYSERTLCTTLIDYGDFDVDGEFNSPLLKPKKRYYRSSSAVLDVHRPSDTIHLPIREQCRVLYIPTSYAGNKIYGPYHAYEDATYRRWQKELFKCLPSLVFKVHPKSMSKPPNKLSLEFRRLEDCIPDYDVLIIDYFATGSMLALVSDKPVIYFDIGLRRLHSEFDRDVKSRCEYARIDMDEQLNEQIEVALDHFWSANVKRDNTCMARFAICSREEFDWYKFLWSVARQRKPNTD